MEKLSVVKAFAPFLLLTSILSAEFSYGVENSNISVSQGSVAPYVDKTYVYNYDRLRFRGDYLEGDFFFTLIGDAVNYYGEDFVESLDFKYIKLFEADTPFGAQTSYREYGKGSAYAKLYRLYGGYEDDKNRVVVGVQNVSMGVGRVWNPTNLFNPRNSYALEPDETFGVLGVSYARHLSDNSSLRVVASQKGDESFKYAGLYNAYLNFADFGVSVISSDETKMIGYEIEGDLADSGVELRSEGAYIKNEVEFFQAILGADYGFVNGVSVGVETLYSSESFSYVDALLNYDSEIAQNLVYSNFYTALTLSYSPTIYLDTALLYIESFNDKNSRFVSPTAVYTLNDYNSFTLGVMIQGGEEDSEFGAFENSYYLKWLLSF